MGAQGYYQKTNEQTLPLILLSKHQYTNELNDLYIKNCMHNQQFTAKLGEICLITDEQGCLRKIFVGLDNGTEAQALASVVNKLPPRAYALTSPVARQAQVIWSLAQYRFNRYKKTASPVRILAIGEHEYQSIVAEANAVFFVRDLINTPANDLGPNQLSEITSHLASQYNADFRQWIGSDLLLENYPAIHAVGRASVDQPRLLSLSWGKDDDPLVTLVGKGVCFDSGGLDIKPSAAMRHMKKDMGGAAQVLGLAQWLMTIALPIRLHVLIPVVENAIAGNAFRPGDVLTMRNGLTVEIDNTDAEGRLILADALVKACEERPQLLIDFATLTGAARTAVGTEISAMFSNDDQLAQGIYQASLTVSDPVWRLPLFNGYQSMLDSSIANMANSSSSPYAGAITAALFLQHFISQDTPWVHFDIMAWNVSSKPGKPEGGEAMGMQAVGHYLFSRFLP